MGGPEYTAFPQPRASYPHSSPHTWMNDRHVVPQVRRLRRACRRRPAPRWELPATRPARRSTLITEISIVAGHCLGTESRKAHYLDVERRLRRLHGRVRPPGSMGPGRDPSRSPHRPSTTKPRLSTARSCNPHPGHELSPAPSTSGENHTHVVPRRRRSTPGNEVYGGEVYEASGRDMGTAASRPRRSGTLQVAHGTAGAPTDGDGPGQPCSSRPGPSCGRCPRPCAGAALTSP